MDKEIPDWATSCPSGKIKFSTAAEARRMYRQKNNRSAAAFKGTVHVYLCQICDWYHTTSTRSRQTGR
jgi:uncharacterized protein YjaZ